MIHNCICEMHTSECCVVLMSFGAARLSAVSRHLTLDRSRGWQEIEDEWAEAEAADKRKQLQVSQKILKTRAQV